MMQVTNLPPNIKVTRIPGNAIKHSKEELIERRRREIQMSRQAGNGELGSSVGCGGKRKFEERMTLTEAKVTDFQDTKDYVDFIQAKLKNVNIKLIK